MLFRINVGLDWEGLKHRAVDNIQVWDSVWSDADLQGDHLRMFKRWDLQDRVGREGGENLVKKWKEKNPEMAKFNQKLRPCTQLVGPEPPTPPLHDSVSDCMTM